MSTEHDYSLSLILNKEDAAYIRSVSKDLKLSFGDFIPHMTVTFSGSKPKKPNLLLDGVAIDVRNLYFSGDDEQRVWVGLTIDKTDALTSVYKQCALSAGVAYDADQFFPHVTLGCMNKNDLDQIDVMHIGETSRGRTFHGTTLSVCRNGEYGKVVEVLG